MATLRAQMARAGVVLGGSVAKVIFTVVEKGTQFGVTVALKTAAGTDEVQVCDSLGKIKTYAAVDDFITAATKIALITSMAPVSYEFSNVSALEPAVFTGDIVAKTTRLVASYVTQSTKAGTDITAANTVIALLPESTAGEIAFKAEKTAQRDSIVALKAWLDSEVTRLNALLA